MTPPEFPETPGIPGHPGHPETLRLAHPGFAS
jgi:hypothetical protein